MFTLTVTEHFEIDLQLITAEFTLLDQTKSCTFLEHSAHSSIVLIDICHIVNSVC